MSFYETPRSTMNSSRDERFYTPRMMSNSNRSNSSDEYTTPREFPVPVGKEVKETLIQDKSYLVNNPMIPHRSSNVRRMPESSYPNTGSSTQSLYSADSKSTHQPPAPARNTVKYVSDETGEDDDIEAIFRSVRHSRKEEVERHLDAGIPVDIRDKFGNTLLITAAQNGNKSIAKLLLRRGANMDARNHKGNSALHYCFQFGYGDSLGEYLISKGANEHIRNNSGKLCREGI